MSRTERLLVIPLCISLFVSLFLLTLSACDSESKENPLQERPAMAAQSTDTKTYCIGRHLIDLPVDFELSGNNETFRPEKSDVKTEEKIEASQLGNGVTVAEFKSQVAKRRIEILAQQHMYLNTPMLAHEESLNDHSVLLRSYESIDSDKNAFRSELHVLVGDVHAVLTTVSYEASFAAAEQRLLAFSRRLEQVNPDVKTGSGFCFGSLLVKGQLDKEAAELSFHNKKHPDLVLNISVDTYAKNDKETLLQRVSGSGLLGTFNVAHTVLRKGDITVAGMKAQEWLAWTELGDDKHKQHAFSLETIRPVPSPDHPLLGIELETGQQGPNGDEQKASLSDKDAVAMWDGIVRTIRLR
ncbi:T6SS immunity protein Tli4 family protein [Undibacterium sp.]|uniref:T6SS immunity protein Tli4 family protein n=1 Tax=Undibacterium sp. TaxID=1914977 RepID=UPI00374D5342